MIDVRFLRNAFPALVDMRARCKIESPAYTQYIVTHADAFLRIRYASHKFYALM